jgi:hypothetical protein
VQDVLAQIGQVNNVIKQLENKNQQQMQLPLSKLNEDEKESVVDRVDSN